MSFNLSNHAVLVSFNVNRPTLSRVDKALTEEQRANHGVKGRKTLKTVKDLFGAELEDVEREISRLRESVHYHMTIPWLDKGSALLVTQLYMDYSHKMRDGIDKINNMIKGLDYQAIMARRRIALNGTFNEADYPTEYDFKSGYSCSFSVNPLPASGQFSHLEGMVDYEIALATSDLETRMVDAHREAMKNVWQRVYDAVSRVHITLKDGQYQRVHDSLIGDIADLVAILPALNLDKDPQLDRVAAALKEKLVPVQGTIETCKREGADVHQKQVAAEAQAILDMMSGYLV